jgi:prepilin-type N-terminal cleavage/methylation domain-containing protein
MLQPAVRHITERDGFTLLEIAIVITLISVIGAVAIPRFEKARTTAVQAQLDRRFGWVDETLKALPAARVAFEPSKRMHYGRSERLTVLVSQALTADELTAEFKRRTSALAEATAMPIRIAPEMEVRLTGDAFEIQPVTSMRQAVGKSEPVEWTWTVMPKKGGSQTLMLAVDAVLTPTDGQPVARSLRVLEQPIEVEITTLEQAQSFIVGNWQFVLGTILIPFGVWRWSERRDTRKTRGARGRKKR